MSDRVCFSRGALAAVLIAMLLGALSDGHAVAYGANVAQQATAPQGAAASPAIDPQLIAPPQAAAAPPATAPHVIASLQAVAAPPANAPHVIASLQAVAAPPANAPQATASPPAMAAPQGFTAPQAIAPRATTDPQAPTDPQAHTAPQTSPGAPALAPSSTAASSTTASTAASSEPAEDIRDIRGAKYLLPPWLLPALLAGAVLLAFAVYGAWRWQRRRRRPRALLPFEIALQRLEEIRVLMQPTSAREFSTAVSDIVRRYIEQRFDVTATHRTTEEFLHDLLTSSNPALSRHRGLLSEFLHQCDLVKFAGMSLSAQSMESLHQSARAFVLETAKPDEATETKPLPASTDPLSSDPLSSDPSSAAPLSADPSSTGQSSVSQSPRIKEAHDSLPST